MILGLHGVAGSGKDTIANYLVKTHGWVRVALADPIRDALYALNPLVPYWDGHFPLQIVVDRVGWDQAKREREVRRLLQVMGTEVGRDLLGVKIWLDKAEEKILEYQGAGVVVTDVRFMDELYWLDSIGGVSVKVKRPGYGPVNSHVSDAGLLDDHFDYLLENRGTVQDLQHSVEHILKEERAWSL